jgi:signal transduction histidine kinase
MHNFVNLYMVRARETNTQLSLSVECTLPPTLMLDESRLRQVLTNLVCNAIKFSPGATVHLLVGYDDSADGALLAEVIDTGRGVDEDMRKRLFKPYEQHLAAELGSGLGLAICHGLVDLMNGQIGYRNTPRGGATFWIRIPAAQPALRLPA